MAAGMTMAAEFPDVFQLFDSPKQKTTLASDADSNYVDTSEYVRTASESTARNYVDTSEYVRTASESTAEEKNSSAKRRRGTDPGPSGRKKQITSRDGGRNEGSGRMTGDGGRNEGSGRMTGDGGRNEGSGRRTGDGGRNEGSGRRTGNGERSEGSGRRTGGGKDEGVNVYNDHSYSSDSVASLPSHTSPSLADIDDILSSLGKQDDILSSSLYLTKAAFGCSWGGAGRSCSHGDLCPFVRQYLALSDLSERQLNPAKSDAATNNKENKENVQRVVVVKQTSQGLVKVNESLHLMGGGEQVPKGAVQLRPESSSQQSWDSAQSYSVQLRPDQMLLLKNQNTRVTLATAEPRREEQFAMKNNTNQMGQQSRHSNQARQQSKPGQHNRMEQLFQYNDASSQQSFMRAVNASNSNVTVKCPSASPTFVQSSTPSPTPLFPTPSPSPPTVGDQVTTKMMHTCPQCGTDFFDSKTLTKHTRNHHQPYTCTKPGCDEQTVGYYRMAVHTKNVHKKTPSFACECGRNFAEKKGLTKHQNNCPFVN